MKSSTTRPIIFKDRKEEMSDLTPSSPVSPLYELDSVNEEHLEALILQLGLKKHSPTAMDPCCVICRQKAFLVNQTIGHHSLAGPNYAENCSSSSGIMESQIKHILSQLSDIY